MCKLVASHQLMLEHIPNDQNPNPILSVFLSHYLQQDFQEQNFFFNILLTVHLNIFIY